MNNLSHQGYKRNLSNLDDGLGKNIKKLSLLKGKIAFITFRERATSPKKPRLLHKGEVLPPHLMISSSTCTFNITP